MANVQRFVALPQQSVWAGLEHRLALVGLLYVYDLRALHLGVPGPRQHPFGDSMYIGHHSGHLQTQTNRSLQTFVFSTFLRIYHMGTQKEGNVLFNDALNTFYLRLYGIRHMVKDHSDSERGNPLPPHGLFLISSKGSFICIIPMTG